MEWSPQDALKAYLHTLQLCRIQSDQDLILGNTSSTRSNTCIEPKCMEFISALAAGNRARLILQITSEGITPLTISLAVAAKQSGGRLIVVCINSDHDGEKIRKTLFLENGLDDVVEYVCGIDPCLLVKQLKNVDFAVVDCKVEDHLKCLKIMNFNPKGCMVVLNNLDNSERDNIGGSFLDQVFKKKRGFKFVTLPLGEGMELTRFRSIGKCQSKRCTRFHVTFEN